MQEQEIETVNKLATAFNLEKGLVATLSKSQAVRKAFIDVVAASGLESGDKKVGNMLYSITTKVTDIIKAHQKELAKYVGSGEIGNPNQLDYAIDYLKAKESKGGVSTEEFKKDCGIGKSLSKEEIQAIVNEKITGADEESKKVDFLIKVKEQIPFVEGKVLKDIFDQTWKAKGLPENVNVDKKKKAAKKADKVEEEQEFHIKDISQLIGREMKSALNSKELIEKRNKEFGDIILTRFPPEPNGYLHIGHCKAMRFNFMQAKMSKGKCYLRFDDTNPLKENIEFIENIKENISFMGYEPWKITHASDNFDKLYDYAIQLIKQGDAFVCSESKEEVKKKRNEALPSQYRDRSVDENLRLFKEMTMGLHAEGSMALRAKIDYKHPNTTLRDPAIYRIRFTPHPHVGEKWCVYPLYDYTHPLCDSLEGISHSLCSLEFEIRRQLYYWVLEKLNIFKPNVWEYSRLNITYTVLSKRKLHELIFTNRVRGWDDPRVLTINGMRRRGYPAEAINNFCDSIGVTRRGNENYLGFNVLEHEVRKYLDTRSPRMMAVLDPVLMVIEGVKEETLTVPFFPKDETKGTRQIKLTSKVWVERADIKKVDEKGFFGIAPNKCIGLKYASTFFITEVVEENGVIVRVNAKVDEKKSKVNSFLSWISCEEAVDVTARTYQLLFTCEKPGDFDNYLDYLNKDSEKEFKAAKFHKGALEGLKMDSRFQFERTGFFCLDKDSNIEQGKLVFNETVGLVERKVKK